MASTTNKLGATGDFPDGKLGEQDDALRLSIGHEQGKVMIHFGKPVAWLGMPPQDAIEFASLLIKQARAVAKETGDVLEIHL
jgi:hypothetical protein